MAVRASRAATVLRCLGLLTCLAPFGAAAQTSRAVLDFKGRLLVVASDGDMQASAYAGGVLGPPARDLLSVIRLGDDQAPVAAGVVEVPNSVIGPPAALSVSPDGRYAIVAETRGPRPADRPDAWLQDLPPGRAITVVDLRDPNHPSVVQQLTGRDNPVSVSIRGDGGLVAIAYDTPNGEGMPLELYSFAAGRLSRAGSPVIPGFSQGDTLKNAAFSPSGVLGLVYATRPRLSLVQLSADDQAATLTPWGDDVPLGRTPFEVRFTPDGRFALVNDMSVPAEGTDVRGTVTSIAIDASRTADDVPQHRIVSDARTGVMPEGLAISPDARWVATTNLERTAYAADDPRQGFFASVTLLRFDPQTGQLSRVGDFPFAGVIPEALVFDNSSRYLAVTSFDHLSGEQASRGSVDFWRIAGDFQDPARVELAPTGLLIPVPRGAQSMEIVR